MDVGALPIQRSTLNHYLATPNKLFECLAAGVPVVASDFPAIRSIVTGDPDGPLGVLCDPTSVDAVAEGDPVDAGPPGMRTAQTLRDRCLTAAHERWNWEGEVAGLVALHRELAAAARGPAAAQRK